MVNDKDNDFQNISGTRFLELDEKVDKKFLEKYDVGEKIGEGGQASVFKVYDKKLDSYRAMKVIHPHFSANKEFIRLFKNEVSITTNLNHPNIVKVYDADVEGDKAYIVMDYVNHVSLKNLPLSLACISLSQVAEAIDYAHKAKLSFQGNQIKGIVHGDVKPENILFREDGLVMIMDFGLAGTSLKEKNFDKSSPLGTWAYAAPEVFDNSGVSVKTDIYSLGVTLNKLITGLTGFEDKSQKHIFDLKQKNYSDLIDRSKIPNMLFKIIHKATHVNPDMRYDTVEEFKTDLDDFIEKTFLINNSYKNIMGAYINFKSEPVIKSGGGQKERKRGLPPRLPAMLIMIAIAVIIAGIYFSGFLQQFFEKDEHYRLIIDNNLRMNFEIWLEDELIGEIKSNQRVREFFFTDSGEYLITLKNPDYQDFSEIVFFSSDFPERTVSYEPTLEIPQRFLLIIENPQRKDEIVFLNDRNIGRLDNRNTFIYDDIETPGTYTLKIGDDSTDFYLSAHNNQYSWTYSVDEEVIDEPLPRERYVLIIDNPNQKNEDVYLNNRLIGSLDGRTRFIYDDITAHGRYTLRVGDLHEDIYINRGEFEFRWTYRPPPPVKDPPVAVTPPPVVPEPTPEISYFIEIENPMSIEAGVFVNGTRVGRLQPLTTSKFDLPDSGEKRVQISSPLMDDYVRNVVLSERRPGKKIVFDPPIYRINISNPDNVRASVFIKEESYDIRDRVFTTYKKSFMNVTVKAEGFEDELFEADFSIQDEYNFVYKPSPKLATLKIMDLPANFDIFINGDPILNYRYEDNIVSIDDLPVLKNYQLTIKGSGYKDFETSFTLDLNGKSLYFSAEETFGKLRLNGITENLSTNSTLFINDSQFPVKDFYNNLPLGRTDLVFVYRTNDYLRRSNPIVVDIKSADHGETVINLTDFGIDLISVHSNIAGTRIYFSNQFVGTAPIDIVLLRETIFTLRAITDNDEDFRNVNLSELDETRIVFRFATPQVISMYDQALEFYERGDLISAEGRLNELLEIDTLYEDALLLRMDIVYEQLQDARLSGNRDGFNRHLSKLDSYLESAILGLERPIDKLIVYKNAGKEYFEYANQFISDNQHKVVYLERNALAMLERAENYRPPQSNLIEEIRHTDEARCYLAMTYQLIYEITNNEEFKNKAIRIWAMTPFHPYRRGLRNEEPNPYKPIKDEWFERIRN